MVHTSKSEAMAIFSSAGVCPYDADATGDPQHPDDPQKVRHYGYLGRITDGATENFLAVHDTDPTLLSTARTPKVLADTIVNMLSAAVARTADPLAQEWSYLEASQARRAEIVPRRGADARDTVFRGIRTLMMTTPLLYDALGTNFGRPAACKPDDWPLLYHAASLNARHLDLFGTHYLVRHPDDLKNIVTQTPQTNGTVRLRFDDDFPDNVPIATDQGVINLKDAPTSGPTVGCPIIFTPKHVRNLWKLYVTERNRIEDYTVSK